MTYSRVRTSALLIGAGVLLSAASARAQGGAAAPGAAVAREGAAAHEPVGDEVKYGLAVRLPRWVSVPRWLLGAFLQQSVPLSTFSFGGVEFIRRKETFDIVVGLAYQNMSPPDGNWLGRNKTPALDTDLLQFRKVGLLALDASFFGRRRFNPYLGMRYGAGLGLALVRGELLRTSSAFCTRDNVGDTRACRPKVCPATGCTEPQLKATEGNVDGGPDFPSRFPEQNVPSALPVVNLSFGLDFHLPDVPGLEARLEGGFYDAFFVGLGFGYIFK
jgi:hypothetical protein